jgi:hypothetical protein
MPLVSKESYLRLIENRPYKFSEEEVNYREAEGEVKCSNCVHFYTRKLDSFHTCEILRPAEDASIDPERVCDFHTVDGEKFPLLESNHG